MQRGEPKRTESALQIACSALSSPPAELRDNPPGATAAQTGKAAPGVAVDGMRGGRGAAAWPTAIVQKIAALNDGDARLFAAARWKARAVEAHCE